MAIKQLKFFQMNNLPIRYKLIIMFLLISILPSIGLGLLIDYTVERIVGRQVNENTIQLIGKVNRSLEFYVSNMQNMTYLIAFDPGVKQFLQRSSGGEAGADDEYTMRKFLQGFTTLYSEIAGIMVVNGKGEYISNELYARSDRTLTEESWYKAAVNSKGIFKIVGKPSGRNITSHANYTEDEVISVARAILNPETQQVEGVVLIDLKLRVIAEAVKDVRLGKTGYLLVIDNDGSHIYSPAKPIIRDIPKEWTLEGGAGSFAKTVQGEELQFIYRKSTFTDWTTVGVFSTKESALEVQEIRFYVISFVFFLSLLSIAAAIYLAYSMSRPINQLMSFMQKAESGDMTIRYWGEREDEVGQLGRSFNTMLAQVNRLLLLTELQGKQKREAELRSLQAHIKPHFLYNTLDTIHWMARNKGAEDVAEVVQSLSRLFRIGLSKGNDIIPLSDEIEHIQSYLTIQKTRYKDKLNYTLDVEDDVRHLYVLKLLLQPIVENAIYHGIKERRGPGHIAITAKAEDGSLLLRISDDGKGMTPEKLTGLRQAIAGSVVTQTDGMDSADNRKEWQGQGYGIQNVQARIQLTFGERYGMAIDSEEGVGTTVTIVHPILKDITG
ncbi:cache domain-containing sensor histidine kinase [Paenibacillus harenae]|uniref:cache domain-containing sensor histidine kinase n=1 Tax=Paenibacillus harenae TaxID=306543 RepID=UPI002792FD82|nr:sensor histidine kinase [Paenibacillus harenae]MDQ0063484.1 two-component system sensor histidine kinase YesM [Paenibacillus harenae]